MIIGPNLVQLFFAICSALSVDTFKQRSILCIAICFLFLGTTIHVNSPKILPTNLATLAGNKQQISLKNTNI